MASPRYAFYSTPDAPEEPPREYTKKEKAANWWHYNKWYVIAAAAAAVFVGSLIFQIATKKDPDYQFAIIDSITMPVGVTDTLQAQLATLCDDRNGDGEVLVSVMEYTIAKNGENAVDPNMQMAGITKLMADAQNGETMIFLTKDPEGYQKTQGIFAANDGSTLAENEIPSPFGVAWKDCPVLTALDLGNIELYDGKSLPVQNIMAEYKLVKRVYHDTAIEEKEKQAAYYESAMALFDQLTAQ